jgi:hypothetical protein
MSAGFRRHSGTASNEASRSRSARGSRAIAAASNSSGFSAAASMGFPCIESGFSVQAAVQACDLADVTFDLSMHSDGVPLGSGPRGRRFKSCRPDFSQISPNAELSVPACVGQCGSERP